MKAPALFRLCFFLVVLSILFVSPRKILASTDIFSDDFTVLNENNWNITPNSGEVQITDGNNLKLSSPNSQSFPFMYLKNVQIPENDYSIEFKFKFSGVLNYGNGIVLSDKLLTNGTHSDLSASDVIFQIWPTSGSTIGTWTTLCEKDAVGCVGGSYLQLSSTPIETWHSVKIVENGDHYTVTVDDFIFETNDSSRKISQVWVGNPEITNTSVNWASILIDDFRIYQSQPESTMPVIVIPGFGASWDVPALVNGVEGNNWKIPEQVTIYNGLISSLKNAGYKENEDLFIFPYDWRKPLNKLADDLKGFIESKGLQGKKVDIISHSMGGLVARSYAQKYGTGGINKITTSGSPHKGVLDAYGLWEGAVFWDDIWWEKVLLEVTTEANSLFGETKIETLRRIAPSIKDILPTADFLKMDGQILPWDSLNQKNTYLSNLNASAISLDPILIPFWSEDQQTRSTINAVEPTLFDNLRKRWEDGKPAETDPFSFALGDGTVTKESATGPFTHSIKATGSHIDLMTKDENIKAILNSLNINNTSAVGVEPDNRRNAFVAMLRSPGTLEVCDVQFVNCNEQLGIYFPESKLFILPGYNNEDLVVKVKESGFGAYKLHLGNLDESPDWIVEDGNLQTAGQVDFYGVKSNGETTSAIFDNVPPVITISTPQATVYQSSNLPSLTYTVTDNWDTSPEVEVSGWSITEGQHTATVKATDSAGNIGTRSVTYTVQKALSSKDQCKNNLWQLFSILGFKNQGACVSFVERNSNPPKKLFPAWL